MKTALRRVLFAMVAAGSLPLATGSAWAQLGGFQCPLKGKPQVRQGDSLAKEGGRFNSNRGAGKKHGGLDLNSTEGNDVLASLAGRAAVAQENWDKMGTTVIVDHGAGAYTVYGHLKTVNVKEDTLVTTGQKIGTVGYSGNASGLKRAKLPAHLHFALIQAGQTKLADKDGPLRQMKNWADYWQDIGAGLTGAVNPSLFGLADCWTGSTTTGAPGEK
jgi:murein DD-endopeptidase MepM/ murein hydrolase activator NlpD